MAQTELGKAFEYACIMALYERYSPWQDVQVIENEPYITARKNYHEAGIKQDDLFNAGCAAVRMLHRLEPRLAFPGGNMPLYLSLQSDAAGQRGDVRDVLCIRQNGWEIGLSCKHNHHAVKHSRLSNTIDFGERWFGTPCSDDYFEEIRPVFDYLADLRMQGKETGTPILFESFPDVAERFYMPVLYAFIKELKRISDFHDGIPSRLIHYLMGRHDFYKIITDDTHRVTKLEAVNINGTLGQPSDGHKSIVPIPVMKLPTEFYKIGLLKDSTNTVEVVCDNAWTITMRIHSASKRVEPSLKFDINLRGTPGGFYLEMEPWDK